MDSVSDASRFLELIMAKAREIQKSRSVPFRTAYPEALGHVANSKGMTADELRSIVDPVRMDAKSAKAASGVEVVPSEPIMTKMKLTGNLSEGTHLVDFKIVDFSETVESRLLQGLVSKMVKMKPGQLGEFVWETPALAQKARKLVRTAAQRAQWKAVPVKGYKKPTAYTATAKGRVVKVLRYG